MIAPRPTLMSMEPSFISRSCGASIRCLVCTFKGSEMTTMSDCLRSSSRLSIFQTVSKSWTCLPELFIPSVFILNAFATPPRPIGLSPAPTIPMVLPPRKSPSVALSYFPLLNLSWFRIIFLPRAIIIPKTCSAISSLYAARVRADDDVRRDGRRSRAHPSPPNASVRA